MARLARGFSFLKVLLGRDAFSAKIALALERPVAKAVFGPASTRPGSRRRSVEYCAGCGFELTLQDAVCPECQLAGRYADAAQSGRWPTPWLADDDEEQEHTIRGR